MKNGMRNYEIAAAAIFGVWLITMLVGGVLPDKYYYIIEFVFIIVSAAIAAAYFHIVRNKNIKLLKHISKLVSPVERYMLDSFPLPSIVIDQSARVRWYNESAEEFFSYGEKKSIMLRDFVRGYDQNWDLSTRQNVLICGKGYTLYGMRFDFQNERFAALYFHNDDDLKRVSDEYYKSRPVTMIITIDNYDEVLRDSADLEKTKIIAGVEEAILRWKSHTNGMLLRYDREKYMFLVEERDFKRLKDDKFDILDEVRKQVRPDSTYPTLSIGIGHGCSSFDESEKYARQALDMALGRGGDQAAVYNKDNKPDMYEFFGGITKGIERSNKVRSRVIAASLENLIKQSSNVLIVGHVRSDMDSVGASVGLQFISAGLGKEAKCVVNEDIGLASSLIEYVRSAGLDIFVSPQQSKKLFTDDTLVIVVDNQRADTVDAPELVSMTSTVVVIDHHRRSTDSLQNTSINYIEPSSSSASEMVTEFLQYMSCGNPSKVQSEALLAGIMLDTKEFTHNTGVRTFEAATYLRRRNADVTMVKRLFAEPFESYALKNKFLGSLVKYRATIFAIITEPISFQYANRSASIAADELASLDGVDASFAVYSTGEQVNICARSSSRLNVQLIMEKIGGGGHHGMAGAQLKGVTLDEALIKLKLSIDQTYAEMRQESEKHL